MEWKEVRIGDYMQCNPKRTIKKGQVARKITMDLLVPHSKQIYSWNYEAYSGGAKFQNGDTIMARITPCLENGKHSFVSILEDKEVAYGSTEYFVFCGKEGISDNEFVYYLSKAPLFRDTTIKSMVGSSGRQRAQMDVIENLVMRVPADIDDQRRIASILSSLDRKIELNNKINAQLEEMAQAIFKSWFVDFEPFKDGKFVESELGLIPEGWRVGTLGEICSTNKRSFGKKMPKHIQYLDTGSISNNRIDSLQDFDTEEEKIPSRAKRAVVEGDIIYSTVRPNQRHYGLLYNPPSNLVVSTGFCVITAKWSAYRYYIYQILSQLIVIEKLQAIAEQSVSTYPSLNSSDIENYQILIPTKEIIEYFALALNSIHCRYEIIQQENLHLAQLRDTLLPKLMNGEIEI